MWVSFNGKFSKVLLSPIFQDESLYLPVQFLKVWAYFTYTVLNFVN